MARYSKRMEHIRASEIREILKLTQRPGLISFAGGLPAPELFPVKELIEINEEVLKNHSNQALQYGLTEGYGPLRKAIAKRMEKVHVKTHGENILVISGSQQGLDFTAKIFLDKDDVVLCESPTYLGAINAFKAYEPKFVEVETDKDGMVMEDLEKKLKENKNIKLIYVIPDFQNPSGITWSINRRKKLVELANKYDVVIVEDSPYGELRFEGEILPAVMHYDTQDRVIFLGTFSKTLCPGMRIGWVAASKEILNKYILVKQGADLQSSTITQMEIARFMEEYDYDGHIEKIKEVYGKRRDLMMDTIKKEFPEGIKYNYPEGGLFTWIELPECIDTRKLALKALEENVAFIPGGSFYPNGGHENAFRLNFSNMEEDRIVEGIKRLGKVLKEELHQ